MTPVRVSFGTPSPGAITDRAIDLLAAGDDAGVRTLVEPLTRAYPTMPRPWQLLALAARAAGDTASALTAIDRASALAPADVKIALARATIHLDAGLPAAALWTRIAASVPADGEVALSAAAALAAEGQGDAADAMIASRLRAEPGWIRGNEALATMRWLRGDGTSFDASFAQAVQARPLDLPLRLAWHRAVSQVGQHTRACDIVARARAAIGDRIELDAADAFLATEMGRDAEAERLFNAVGKLEDQGTKVAQLRHLMRTGRIERARALAEALVRTPGARVAWPYLATIWRMTGDERAVWLDGQPPFVAVHDLPLTSGELDAAATLLRRLHRSAQHPPEQSMRGGTQTEGSLFARIDPALAPVRAAVLRAVRTYVDALPPIDRDHPLLGMRRDRLRFAGSWSVRLGAQGHHVDHTHPMGWISSALYVALPDAAALGPAPAGWLALGAAPANLRVDVPAYRLVAPRLARLVLFPSTMWHRTLPFSDGERLTIAFDLQAL